MPENQNLYFLNFSADFLFMGGFSILLFFWMHYAVPDLPLASVMPAALFLQYALNYPHFSATIYRFYRSADNVRQFPMTGIVWPILIVIAVWAALISPGLFASYLITLYLIWSPYHFSGQTVGLTMLYARRSGFFVGRPERLALSAFVFGTFFVLYSQAGVKARLITDPSVASSDEASYLGIPFINFIMPDWAFWVSVAVTAAGGFAFLALTLKWALAHKKAPPLILYIPALAQLFWFVIGFETSVVTFYIFVSTFHSLQYLYVSWAVQLKEAHGDRKIGIKDIAGTTTIWSIMNLCGGIALFSLLPVAVIKIFDTPTNLTLAVVFAAIQIHHFFVDGVIWKLRNKNVLDGLTVNIPQWVRGETS